MPRLYSLLSPYVSYSNCISSIGGGEVFGVNEHGRGRKRRCRGSKGRVGYVAHGDLQRAAVGYIGVTKPDLIKLLSVQANALHIFVVVRSIRRDENEVLAVLKMNGGFREDGAADVVSRNSGSCGIEALSFLKASIMPFCIFR